MEALANKAVDEVIQLIQSVDFTLERDVELPGRFGSAAIFLLEPPKEDRAFSLALRLSGPGYVDVDWSGIGVRLEEIKKEEIKKKERGNHWFKVTRRNGQLTFGGKMAKGFTSLKLRASRSTVVVGRFGSVVVRPGSP